MRGVAAATCRDYMASRLITLDPAMDVLAAMQRLLDERISGAPVVDARGNLIGVLTQRDCLTVAVQSVYSHTPAGRVSDYMSAPADTLEVDAGLMEVIEAFRRSRYRRFPVVEEGRLVGLICRRDILRAILELW